MIPDTSIILFIHIDLVTLCVNLFFSSKINFTKSSPVNGFVEVKQMAITFNTFIKFCVFYKT